MPDSIERKLQGRELSGLTSAVHDVATSIREQEMDREIRRRFELGSSLMALGNIAVGALLFGQAVSGVPFDFRLAFLGLTALALMYAWALAIMKGGEG